VKSVIPDKDAVTDIKEIKPLAVMKRDYTYLALISLGGAALLALTVGEYTGIVINIKKARPFRPGPPTSWPSRNSTTSERKA